MAEEAYEMEMTKVKQGRAANHNSAPDSFSVMGIDSNGMAAKRKAAETKTWAGKSSFMCKGRCVSGPWKEIWPSIVVYAILFSVSIIWASVCLPFLFKDHEHFAEPNGAVMTIDLLLFLISVLTIAFAIKTQLTDPGIIYRDPKAAAQQAAANNQDLEGAARSKAHIYR